MPRLQAEFLERAETFSDRMLDLVESLPARRVSGRILDQISAAGTSVGANIAEADEAMSRNDFVKSLGIAAKELSESRFWIRTCGRRQWVKPSRLGNLESESVELRKIVGTMIYRSKSAAKRRPATV